MDMIHNNIDFQPQWIKMVIYIINKGRQELTFVKGMMLFVWCFCPSDSYSKFSNISDT